MKKITTQQTKLLALLAALTLVLAVSACSDDDDPVTPTPTPDKPMVRVQHLFPDADGVDVYATPLPGKNSFDKADSIKVFTDIDYRESSAFAEVSAGSYKIDVTLTGDDFENAVLTVPSLALMNDKAYTALAWDDGNGIAALPLEDDLTAPGAGNIRIRAIHAASAVGAVDIWNVTDPNNPGVLWENLDTGTAGAYLEVPAQAYTLGIDLNDDMLVDVFVEVPALAAGSIVNAFASLDATGNFFVLAQLQDGTTAAIDPAMTDLRVVHASPSAGNVDVWVNAAVSLLEDFAFTSGSAVTPVGSATYDIQLTTVGGNPASPLLEIQDLTLLPGAATAVAWDDQGATALLLTDDMSTPADGAFRVRPIHVADGIDQVDIWNTTGVTPSPLWVDLDRGASGDYLELPADTYQVGIDTDDDATPDLLFNLPFLAAGEVVNVFAINDGGTVFLLAQLFNGTTARIDAQ